MEESFRGEHKWEVLLELEKDHIISIMKNFAKAINSYGTKSGQPNT